MEPQLELPARIRNRGADTEVRGLRVFSWNPRPPFIRRRYLDRVKQPVRTNNFGDVLGPVIVDEVLESRGVDFAAAPSSRRVFAVGSVLHFCADGDVVWGSGVNGKSLALMPAHPRLDVRAVRGPETRRELERRGVEVPEVYGDPALLLPVLFPAVRHVAQRKRRRTLIVPNLHEYRALSGRSDVLNPRAPMGQCLQAIAESERVVGTSLHGLIVAEAFGIPATPVASTVEHPFKYLDYYGGTGRSGVAPAPDLESALDPALSGRYDVPPPQWDPAPLLAAFPVELWDPSRG